MNVGEFKKQQMQDFSQQKTDFKSYKKKQENEFKKYQKAQKKAFNNYKKEISAFWKTPKMSTKKSWVAYSKDKRTRTNVDFLKETIVVETIALSKKDAEQKLKLVLAKIVTINNKTVQETDPLERKLDKIKKPNGIITAKVKADPILSIVVFNNKPTKKSIKNYVNEKVKLNNITITKSKIGPTKNVYSIKIQMPKDAMLKRSRLYYDEIRKHASIQKMPASLIFAIMQTESSFNPRARSHTPAYGLMQIVPRTAGIDTYKYLYNKKRLVSSSYLYNSKNNITMGSAYLHILYYRYLKHIKNPTSRLYCTIAAYNTGAGNIAWAFTRTYNMKKAAPYINKLTPKQVYNKLLKNLRYDEPKHYLKRVSNRMIVYGKIY